jgi:hypothetical protein
MKQYLWQNKKLYVWKIEGTITNLVVGNKEPEDINYYIYSAFRPRAKQRGTMYGNPSFFENYDTFYGSIRYDTISMKTRNDHHVTLQDVIVIRKFQTMIAIGSTYEIYLISAHRSGEGTLLFALRANSTQIADLEGIGSLVETMQASITRQLKFIMVPVIISFIFFGSFAFSIIASLEDNISDFPYIPITTFIVIVVLFFVALAFAGTAFLKKKIQIFPSKAVLKKILIQEGFHL